MRIMILQIFQNHEPVSTKRFVFILCLHADRAVPGKAVSMVLDGTASFITRVENRLIY